MFYVRMHDKFMSGWGLAANRRNIYVVACDTLAQAEAIERAAHCRPEMRRVSLCENKPRENGRDLFTWKKFSQMGGPWLAYYREEITA